MIDLNRRPRMGLLLISPERFQTIGEGTARGSYLERKQKEAEWMGQGSLRHRGSDLPRRHLYRRGCKAGHRRFRDRQGGLCAGDLPQLGGGLRLDPLPAGYARLPGAVLPSDARQDRAEGHP